MTPLNFNWHRLTDFKCYKGNEGGRNKIVPIIHQKQLPFSELQYFPINHEHQRKLLECSLFHNQSDRDETTKENSKPTMRQRFGLVTCIETKSWFFSSTRNLHFYYFTILKLCSKTVKEYFSFDLSKGKIKCDLSFTYNGKLCH